MTYLGILVAVMLLLWLYRQSTTSGSSAAYSSISVAEAKALLAQGAIPLDVRTVAEHNSGKIKKAVNIDVMQPTFAQDVAALDTNKSYLVYCRSGRRSQQACRIMGKQGFDQVHNLKGGMTSWNASR